jgi:2-oxoglutarate ferredoxin oxidoreductase subunit delta
LAVTIFPAWCKKCGLCHRFCPAGVFERDESGRPYVAHGEKCVNCRMCELRCPDFAISVDVKEEKAK